MWNKGAENVFEREYIFVSVFFCRAFVLHRKSAYSSYIYTRKRIHLPPFCLILLWCSLVIHVGWQMFLKVSIHWQRFPDMNIYYLDVVDGGEEKDFINIKNYI